MACDGRYAGTDGTAGCLSARVSRVMIVGGRFIDKDSGVRLVVLSFLALSIFCIVCYSCVFAKSSLD